MSESAGSVVPGAHGPHVGVSAASQTTGPANPLISGRSANEFALMGKQMEHDRKLVDAEWQRRVKAEKRLYEAMMKSQKDLNKNISGIPADSKTFWKRTQNEMSRTLRDMSKNLTKEMVGVSKILEKNMKDLISLSMQRQRKADEALRSAMKTGSQVDIQRASYNSRNENLRLQHNMRYQGKQYELQDASRQKSILEGRMSKGDKLSVDDYRAYERLTDEVRDLENELRKLDLVNKHLASGITDVDQALRAANMDMEYYEKHAKTLDQIVSKAKVDMLEYARNTFTFANAARHAGEALKLLYKDYSMFTEQLYKANGELKLSDVSFTKMAKNADVLQASSLKLRMFAAAANISAEEFGQLNEKLLGTYMVMDKFGNFDSRKYEEMSKEMLNYSRLTGASLDESIGFHAKLRRQFSMTDAQAGKTMRGIIAAQKEVRGSTARSFADFATFDDDFQKSIQSIVDGYDGFKLDVSGVTGLFKEQVKVAEKLGMSYQETFDIAKKFVGLVTKKSSSALEYASGQQIIKKVSSILGGDDQMRALYKKGVTDEERDSIINKALATDEAKKLKLNKDQLMAVAFAATRIVGGPNAMQAADAVRGSLLGSASKLNALNSMAGDNSVMANALLGTSGEDRVRIAMQLDEMRRSGMSGEDMAVKMSQDTDKSGDKNAPNAKENQLFNPGSYLGHLKDLFDNSAFGHMLKAVGTASLAMGAHSLAMGAHTIALMKGAGGFGAGIIGKVMSKIPGLRGLVGVGGATVDAGANVGATGLGRAGKLAQLASKMGTPGRIAAAALLGAGTLYGGYKLFGEGSSPSDQQSATNAVQSTANSADEQVTEQQKTNKKLDEIKDSLSGKGATIRPSGSSLGSILNPGTVATGVAGAGVATASYFALKGLAKGATPAVEKLAAEGAVEGATAGAGKGVITRVLGSTVGKVIGGVIGPALSFALTDGPTGRKASAAAGTALGTFAGGAVGSLLGPVGTIAGAALGGWLGETLGKTAYDGFTGFDENNPTATAPVKGPTSAADQWAKAGGGQMPGDKMYADFMANSLAPNGTAVPGQPFNSVSMPTNTAGAGNGTMVNVSKDGSATLQATIRLDNFSPSVYTSMRDSYNLQNPSSGLSRRGFGMPGGL